MTFSGTTVLSRPAHRDPVRLQRYIHAARILAGLSARTPVCSALLLGVLVLLMLCLGCTAPRPPEAARLSAPRVVLSEPPVLATVDLRRPPSDEFADGLRIHWLVTLRWPVEAERDYEVRRDGEQIGRASCRERVSSPV